MEKIQVTRQIKVGKFAFRQGLCSVIDVEVFIGGNPFAVKTSLNQQPDLTEGDLYKMLDTENWEVTEFPDGVSLKQPGITIHIPYIKEV